MRILIATNMYPFPGALYWGRFVREQELSLRELGVEVEVAAHIGRVSRWEYARALPDLVRRLRRERFDLIHSHHSYSTVLALAARKLAGRSARRADGRPIPIIQTFHEGEVFRRGTDFDEDRLRRLKYSLKLKAWALARVDFAIPVQRDMMRAVLGQAAAKIPSHVIPAGVDMERFIPAADCGLRIADCGLRNEEEIQNAECGMDIIPAGEPDGDRASLDLDSIRNPQSAIRNQREARARLGWDPEGLVVFFPSARDKREKRHDLALAGFELFARNRSAAPDLNQAEARLQVGGIPFEQMPDALCAADVVLMPSDYEASPTVAKEALACERPLVATDVGDVREYYGDLPGVFICDWTPESIARRLEQAAAVRGHFGGRRRLRELRLDLRQVAERLVEVYEQVRNAPVPC